VQGTCVIENLTALAGVQKYCLLKYMSAEKDPAGRGP
jgi:hypothetical protein